MIPWMKWNDLHSKLALFTNCDDRRKFEILQLPEEIHIPAAERLSHAQALDQVKLCPYVNTMNWFFLITVLPVLIQRCHEKFHLKRT